MPRSGRSYSPPWTPTICDRLVEIKHQEDDRAQYQYNGLNWRIKKLSDMTGGFAGGPNGVLDEKRQMYYSANWQLLEEVIDDEYIDDPGDNRLMQYIWGARYIDDIALRLQDYGLDGEYEDVWYHCTDAQFSTVAVLDDAAVVKERVSYDEYGRARHHKREDMNGDGAVNITDRDIVLNNWGSVPAPGDVTRDGAVNTSDLLAVINNYGSTLFGTLSTTDNQIGWCGYVFNGEMASNDAGLYTVRERTYFISLGRWGERDPLMYVDGMNIYEYVRSEPISRMDPTGLQDPGWVRRRERQMLDQLRQPGNVQAGGGSGSASSWVADALLRIQQYAGTEQNFQCCAPTPGGLMACIIVTLSGDLQTCCKNGRRNLCVRIELSVSGGLYAPGSVLPGCTFEPKLKNWKKPISPGQIRRGPGATCKVPLRHGFNSECPKEGLTGRICITGSAGVRSWTVGARGCLNFPGTQPTIDAGFGIGYGTGISIEGGGTYIKCGLDIEQYYPSGCP